MKSAYEGYKQTNLSNVYLTEGAFGSELLGYSFNYNQLYNQLKSGAGGSATPPSTEEIKAASEEFFKNYNPSTDRKVTKAVLEMYYKNVPKDQLPDFYKTVESKYKGDVGKYVDNMFDKSFMTDPKKVEAFLAKPNLKQLEADPALKTMQSIYTNYSTNISPKRAQHKAQLDKASRLYVAGLREMQPEKKFYPDANSTIRLSFGEVKAYIPRDGVEYKYYTTVDGILEKEDPKNEEFVVPQRLLDLIKKKDFGPYAEKNGEMPVAFITTNDITGGNSGSPVINGRGELIGVAFDGNWEAMTGDLVYDKDLKRCINVDIRYVLWIIDKYAGAGHLVKEMDLAYNQHPKATGAAKADARHGSRRPLGSYHAAHERQHPGTT